MHDKDELVRRLHSAVEERLGPDAFLVEGERLASNHVIYTSQFNPGVTVSVIAGREGRLPDRYSVQVEVDIYEPDFAMPFVGDDLFLEEVLAVLEKYRCHPPSNEAE